ncbi:unnamed protein product [Staurois parvus]|uniref:Uncharacterized protein n=1 Tax=Staurois parvus TaxID=386267 RepID=A0ABN9F5D4_9NEOB|nr:unnamed protein product [Staurois parvus]
MSVSISASFSATYQCQSVPPISVHQCPVHQCPSVQPHYRTSVKEKNHLFTKVYNKN